MVRAQHGRRDAPPIIELVELIDEHRAAFDYDWRTRFGMPVEVVGGRRMSWGEACRLLERLMLDPSAHITAAVAGWDYPLSRESIALAGIYNATAKAHFKDPSLWPVPWPQETAGTVIGGADEQVLTQEQIDQVLRDMAGR